MLESLPSTGEKSNLKSPVNSTIPCWVRIARDAFSGIEWVTRTNSTSSAPALMRSPSLTIFTSIRSLGSISSSFRRMSAAVNSVQ